MIKGHTVSAVFLADRIAQDLHVLLVRQRQLRPLGQALLDTCDNWVLFAPGTGTRSDEIGGLLCTKKQAEQSNAIAT